MPSRNIKKDQTPKFRSELSNFITHTMTKKEYDEIMKTRTRPIGAFRTRKTNSLRVDPT